MEQGQETIEQKSMVIQGVDLSALKEVEPTFKSDLDKYDLKHNKIAAIETVRIKSKFAKAQDGLSYNLRFLGEILETKEVEGKKIEIRPTTLIPLEENPDGSLKGLPSGEKSKWQRFKKTLKISNPTEAIGKSLPMKVDGDYLNYLY